MEIVKGSWEADAERNGELVRHGARQQRRGAVGGVKVLPEDWGDAEEILLLLAASVAVDGAAERVRAPLLRILLRRCRRNARHSCRDSRRRRSGRRLHLR